MRIDLGWNWGHAWKIWCELTPVSAARYLGSCLLVVLELVVILGWSLGEKCDGKTEFLHLVDLSFKPSTGCMMSGPFLNPSELQFLHLSSKSITHHCRSWWGLERMHRMPGLGLGPFLWYSYWVDSRSDAHSLRLTHLKRCPAFFPREALRAFPFVWTIITS